MQIVADDEGVWCVWVGDSYAITPEEVIHTYIYTDIGNSKGRVDRYEIITNSIYSEWHKNTYTLQKIL